MTNLELQYNNEVAIWKHYFLNSKFNFLTAFGYSQEEIIAKYELDLVEHRNSYSEWIAHDMGLQKKELIDGLEQAVIILKKGGEQIKMDLTNAQ